MAGTAGSKYGVINDDLPLKKSKGGMEAGLTSKDARRTETELKDLRPLINARLKRNSPAQAKP
ncbi:hypothetical protein EDS67_19145 [candidate division KSB1 bacterium]|nr:MAG: hypothetical protein EDS67_19145 [candidate division KSB1 bacterium]MBC6946658.1 hypothetical protein [candidate division KSB1 bacterium]MCE7943873.1 hypothetical protein [Chlorobi bacterium CHB1]MDL1877336.1 hypothetical protein [Cytophagia bacterium CHB2]